MINLHLVVWGRDAGKGGHRGGARPLALSQGGRGGGKSALLWGILYKCMYVDGTVSSEHCKPFIVNYL